MSFESFVANSSSAKPAIVPAVEPRKSPKEWITRKKVSVLLETPQPNEVPAELHSLMRYELLPCKTTLKSEQKL